jgi:L-arabinose isomerase
LESEFKVAVQDLEGKKLDALITLHLAYSPSLESAKVLAATKLPLVVLDTTPDYAFGPDTTPALIMNNHGIHGVQDMCNLLNRNGKAFAIEVGHWDKSDVLERVVDQVRAARLATALRSARVGLIGAPFVGMGDFSVPAAKLKFDLGVTTVQASPAAVSRLLPDANDAEVKAELASDRKAYNCKALDQKAHQQASRVTVAVNRFIEKEKLSAVTLNFQAVTKASGLPMMPFFGLCKAMAKGTGYAGEGDVLTAALVGSLMRVYPETSFTEMFCPDWKGGRVFMSHMGEINPAVVEQSPELYYRNPWIFSDAEAPVSLGACFKPGKAVFVNLAPTRDGYNLIAAPVTMVSGGKNKKFKNTVRGWMKPAMPLNEFLAEYSRVGGTHHAALVYGASMRSLAGFSQIMNFKFISL